jgi:hypothetical protein
MAGIGIQGSKITRIHRSDPDADLASIIAKDWVFAGPGGRSRMPRGLPIRRARAGRSEKSSGGAHPS